MHFLLSDWFTVSRLTAIIPTFDLKWKLMRHNFFFVGSQAPSAKKSKFGELSTEEIQEITDNVIPVTTTTKKPIKFGMRIINGMYPFKFL